MVKITVDIDSETYYKLKRIAESRGISVYALVKEVLKNMATKPSSSETLESNISANIEPNGVQKNTVVKCIKRSKMRYPLESYINIFKSKGVFVDWWDDGDRVCFELRSESGQSEVL